MLDIASKSTTALLPTDILFQTAYWAQVKARLGLRALAFDLLSAGPWGDVLVLLRRWGGRTIALVPQGPEYAPPEDQRGPFLERFSLALAKCLDPEVAFIRYDLPWSSPYAEAMRQGAWSAFPEARVREMRMNMGTQHWNLRKSFEDLTVASSLVVDLRGSEEDLLAAMKPKTRYNIGLARRRGVTIQLGSADNLPDFHALYRQTARRGGFAPCGQRHFAAMFQGLLAATGRTELLFLLARHGADILAGAIVGISQGVAHFLYGASANTKRQLMAPSLMHWEAMRLAWRRGCRSYEMGAVSPSDDPAHPFHGLYRFKTGFGGRIEYRSGSWDYPLDHDAYRDFCTAEKLARLDAG